MQRQLKSRRRWSRVRLTSVSFVVGCGLLIGQSSSVAQSGNLSDVTGPIVTTSDQVQGILRANDGDSGSPGGDRGGDADSMFSFRCGPEGPVAQQVNVSLQEAIAQLKAGTLPPPSKGLSPGLSAAEFRAAQQRVADLELLNSLSDSELEAIAQAQTLGELQGLLIDAGIATAQAAQLTETLAQVLVLFNRAGIPAEDTAQSLEAIATILSAPSISARQLQMAIATYNQIVNTADLAFLQSPPAEFQVFQTVLERAVVAGLQAPCNEELEENVADRADVIE